MTTEIHDEKENSNPQTSLTSKEEDKKEIVSKEEKDNKKDLIVIGADVGRGKLQKKFEKFRSLRIVFYIFKIRNN